MSKRTNKAERNFIEYTNKMMHKEELKPCPFCGGEVSMTQHLFSGGFNVWHIGQPCLVEPIRIVTTDREQAIEAWNRRAE